MTWSGLALSEATRRHFYYEEAVATARAADARLSDARGVFTDIQGELAPHQAFARESIERNARAALTSRAPDETFARFFDGPSLSIRMGKRVSVPGVTERPSNERSPLYRRQFRSTARASC